MKRPLTAAAVVVALALIPAGCGNERPESARSVTTSGPTAPAAKPACSMATPAPVAPDPALDLSTEPVIPKPEGDPPCALIVEDLKEGTGPAATPQSIVNVHYVGVSWSTGKQFDASWDRGQPIEFPLNRVIKGWTAGMTGMKAGGRRRLVIPPELGYGPEGQPPDIAPNETLVFVVDLLGVTDQPTQPAMPPAPVTPAPGTPAPTATLGATPATGHGDGH
ncbi:MAG TPA: FKBP-type peptidyl-prolyl cis-trans isomerase [Actinomycetota bacterium]|nr:FKBP-type peptidyl-prolyl cis-trans isomerase [Actinomycetota bacterium]